MKYNRGKHLVRIPSAQKCTGGFAPEQMRYYVKSWNMIGKDLL